MATLVVMMNKIMIVKKPVTMGSRRANWNDTTGFIRLMPGPPRLAVSILVIAGFLVLGIDGYNFWPRLFAYCVRKQRKGPRPRLRMLGDSNLKELTSIDGGGFVM